MRIIKTKLSVAGAALALALAIVLAGIHLVALEGKAFAYQPHDLNITEVEIPEPPCPYGHDDACETGPRLTSSSPYQPPDPHAVYSQSEALNQHSEQSASIFRTNRRLLADSVKSSDIVVSGDSGSNDPEDANYAVTAEISNLPWVSDGLTDAERLTRDWLSELQEHNPTLVTALTGMPFLQDHTPGDLQAIQTLTLISDYYDDPEYATAIVNAAGFADDDGVDNTEAKIIAVMSLPYGEGYTGVIDLLTVLGTVEEKTVAGQHGNSIHFAVVRLGYSLEESKPLEAATTSVADAETLMAKALPTDFVGILVASAPFAGANNRVSIWIDYDFDTTDVSDRYRQRVVGHEMAHYWWTMPGVDQDWLSEGAASYVGAYTVWKQFDDSDVYVDRDPCSYYRTIEHLRADRPRDGSWGAQCNYLLGERLFIDLHKNMTSAAFNSAFRDLHRRVSTYDEDGVDPGLSLVRAFCSRCLSTNPSLGSSGYTLARRYGEKIFTNSSEPTGSITGLGQSAFSIMISYRSENRQSGIPEIPAGSPDQRRWVYVHFSDPTNPPETVRVIVQQFHEYREPYYSYYQVRSVHSDDESAWFDVYLGEPHRRAPGHHWVYIYNEDGEKVAETEYQVIP